MIVFRLVPAEPTMPTPAKFLAHHRSNCIMEGKVMQIQANMAKMLAVATAAVGDFVGSAEMAKTVTATVCETTASSEEEIYTHDTTNASKVGLRAVGKKVEGAVSFLFLSSDYYSSAECSYDIVWIKADPESEAAIHELDNLQSFDALKDYYEANFRRAEE
jgi:hypothetical protein